MRGVCFLEIFRRFLEVCYGFAIFLDMIFWKTPVFLGIFEGLRDFCWMQPEKSALQRLEAPVSTGAAPKVPWRRKVFPSDEKCHVRDPPTAPFLSENPSLEGLGSHSLSCNGNFG